MREGHRRSLAALVLAVTGTLAACGGSAAPASSASSGERPTGRITVLAAASLTDAMQTIGTDFERANPGTDLTFSFGSSSALATQIQQGAPADVFASASQRNMDAVVKAGVAASQTPFARNVMQVAVPPSNPARVSRLADLAKPGVKVALCQAEVPCGATAAKVFTNAGLTVTPVTEEADVKATLAKVTLGEVDAAVVYVTDVLTAGDKVTGIDLPDDVNASTTYPIATLGDSRNPALAKALVDHVLSPAGRKVLTAAGFRTP